MPGSFAAAHGCGPAPVMLETWVGTGRRLLMTGCSDGRGDMTLNHGRTLVRLQPGQRNPNACLVITAARLLGTEVVGVQFFRQAPCGCGVVATHHLAVVKTRVRFPVSAPCRSRPIGRASGLRHRGSGFESQGRYQGE